MWAMIGGPDLNQVAKISKKVAGRMRRYPDLGEVNPGLNLNMPELQVKVDRQRAADIGVRMTDIGDAVRLFYSGEDEITRFKEDRKSTRLNSSHGYISYAVFCLKKKKTKTRT